MTFQTALHRLLGLEEAGNETESRVGSGGADRFCLDFSPLPLLKQPCSLLFSCDTYETEFGQQKTGRKEGKREGGREGDGRYFANWEG